MILQQVVLIIKRENKRYQVTLTSGQFEILWKRTKDWNEFFEVLQNLGVEFKELEDWKP